MPTLKINELDTLNQFGSVKLFNPIDDALALRMYITASENLISLPGATFDAVFQIIDPITNLVVYNRHWNHPFEWGTDFWVQWGNNWGPNRYDYDTADRYGLRYTPYESNEGRGIYGFRGSIKAYSTSPPSLPDDAFIAFDISDVRWFRLMPLTKL